MPANKPSLYVVERKEVVLLVILFVLVTVFAFTIGVKYGESLGHQTILKTEETEKELDKGMGQSGGHLADAAPTKVEPAKEEAAKAEPGKIEEKNIEQHSSPEQAAERTTTNTNPTPPKMTNNEEKLAGDSELLEALKGAGVETHDQVPQSGQLPNELKHLSKGAHFAIQVGSYPSTQDAERQVKLLRAKKLEAQVLTPIADKNGQWFRVTIGKYSTSQEAKQAAEKLRAEGVINNFFVRKLN